jgi:hypothetical protein
MLLRVRMVLAERKWILWVVLVLVVLVAYWVGVSLLLPHHVLSSLHQYEEKPNGLDNQPPVRNAPAVLLLSHLS